MMYLHFQVHAKINDTKKSRDRFDFPFFSGGKRPINTTFVYNYVRHQLFWVASSIHGHLVNYLTKDESLTTSTICNVVNIYLLDSLVSTLEACSSSELATSRLLETHLFPLSKLYHNFYPQLPTSSHKRTLIHKHSSQKQVAVCRI